MEKSELSDRLNSQLLFILNQLFNATDASKPTVTLEKIVKVPKKVGTENIIEENTSLAFPSKWDGYLWPKLVKAQLGSDRTDSISTSTLSKPVLLINSLTNLFFFNCSNGKELECFPILSFIELLAEVFLAKFDGFVETICQFHAMALQALNSSQAEEKLKKSVQLQAESQFFVDPKMSKIDGISELCLLLSDSAFYFGDLYRASFILNQVLHSDLSLKPGVQTGCLYRLAIISSAQGNKNLSLLYCKKTLGLKEVTTESYFFAFHMALTKYNTHLLSLETIKEVVIKQLLSNRRSGRTVLSLLNKWLQLLITMTLQSTKDQFVIQYALSELNTIAATTNDYSTWGTCLSSLFEKGFDLDSMFLQSINLIAIPSQWCGLIEKKVALNAALNQRGIDNLPNLELLDPVARYMEATKE